MKSRYITLLLVLTVGIETAVAQEERFMSLYIYNFTKYLEWPVETIKNTEFIIGVYGNSNMSKELSPLIGGKKIGNLSIKVKDVSNAGDFKNCQIVFVAKEKTPEIKSLAQNLSGLSVLMISEKPGFCSDGAHICFVLKNGNLNFEISKSNLTKSHISANSALFSLGTIIN